ncbi:PAS domain-containing protein [Stieleria sp. JC731]|uniref:CheR family methyltransferase n=1 Tax=Pirellulaceae TaxID=2691357 RepID=UPI001E2EB78A|nr:CheR family methyltransferase [Stieleria sp. JC731]MCC9600342.1 PAS domain-containing protein [Stieleria sp. JC731]
MNKPTNNNRAKSIIAIGASAGGLRSLEALFDRLDADTGCAIVVVVHLSPGFKSLMDEILARHTDTPIVNIADGMPVEPNTIYLNNAAKETRIEQSHFVLSDADTEKVPKPIDHFFSSAAQVYGKHCIGVILSGTGSDGSIGVQKISAAGGVTVVESPESAEFNGMPTNALSTGEVDFSLPREQIPELLMRFARDPDSIHESEPEVESHPHSDMETIFSMLCERHGIDFADYKSGTIDRRISRRLISNGVESLADYAKTIQDNPEELDALYFDLLIGVTKFFRDEEAFSVLEHELTEQIKKYDEHKELRIWVAGCATGEEAYSVAMVVTEAFEAVGRNPKFKILATDIHDRALKFAAKGVYPQEAINHLRPEQQERFFNKVDSDLRCIDTHLRRHVIFTRHDVIKDPPFSKIDLIACRNMLIYLEKDAQQSVFQSFHFALESGGILMLGPSEVPSSLESEFQTIDPTWRLYRKLGNLPRFLPAQLKNYPGKKVFSSRLIELVNRSTSGQTSFSTLLDAYDSLLGVYVNSGLLVDESRNVIHVFGDAHHYLRSYKGRPSGRVSQLLPDGVRGSIGAAMVRAAESGKQILLRELSFPQKNGDPENVDVIIRAIPKTPNSNLFLWFIEFVEGGEHTHPGFEELLPSRTGVEHDALRSELEYTKETLNATIEELEASNEQLQSTNQELIASNEELQSTNEELQSVNEELYSVNSENQRQITQLQVVTDDLNNLLGLSDIGTIFLDQDLCIRKFTPLATKYFRLMSHDIGRPIDNFTHSLPIPDLGKLMMSVRDTGEAVVRKFNDRDNNQVILKLMVYETSAKQRGVLINIIDTSAFEASEQQPDESD